MRERVLDQTVLQDRAREYLDTLMADYVMVSGAAVKTADMAREVGDKVGASARLVRNELSRSPRLTLVDRRWDLRARHDGLRRSVDGSLQAVLGQAGKPLSLMRLAGELSLRRQRPREGLVRLIDTLAASRATYFRTAGGLVGLRAWLLEVAPEDDDEAIRRHNFFGVAIDFAAVLESLDMASAKAADTALDGLVALVESAHTPLSSRLLLYALWVARGGGFDPQEVFCAALEDERAALVPGPAFATPAYLAELNAAIQGLSEQHDADGATAEAVVDIHEILEADAGSIEEFSLSHDDIGELQRIIQEAGTAMPLGGLVSDVFELFPGDMQYIAAVRSVSDALRGDDRFVELPDSRWHLRVLLPPTLFRVPVTLQLSPVVVTSLTDEKVDAALQDGGLEGGLEWEVRAPDLEDIGEEDEVPALRTGLQLAARQRFVTTYRHFVSGTTKVRKIDRGVFPTTPPIRPLTLIDKPSGERFELWLNNETGLLCGLDEWFKGRLQPTGQVFYIEHDAEHDVWYGEVDPEPDPMLLIPQPQLDELLRLRVKVEHAQETSVLDIMRQLMEHHTGGVTFRRLYTECNIVRRVAKRVIAGNLSSYPMFRLSEDETRWLFDERRASRPRDPEKKPFVID